MYSTIEFENIGKQAIVESEGVIWVNIFKIGVWFVAMLKAHKKHLNVAQLHSNLSHTQAIHELEGGS